MNIGFHMASNCLPMCIHFFFDLTLIKTALQLSCVAVF